MDQKADLIELDHIIGYNGKLINTVICHPVIPDKLIYGVGGLVIIEDSNSRHNQNILRAHDMPISALTISNTGITFD